MAAIKPKAARQRGGHNDRAPKTSDDNDLVWGAEEIGRVIGRTPAQVYHLIRVSALDGAVKKVSHRITVGSRRKLLELLSGETE